jgi:hypothetical protein
MYVRAQESTVYKIKYLPNKNYQMSMKMGMKLTGTISGDTAVINKLKSSGITQPVNVSMDFGLNANMKSGSVGSDGSFPLVVQYKIDHINVSLSGKQIPIPPKISETNLRMVGRVGSDGIFTIDSVAGKKANDSTQKQMKQMMGLFQKQVQFPNKALKPGDTFTQTVPFNLPVGKNGGGDVHINYSTTYKVTDISGGKAYFDVTPTFSLDFSMQKAKASISGTGTGKMVYSIKDNFPISHDGDFNMTIKVDADKVKVDGNAVITGTTSTVIN